MESTLIALVLLVLIAIKGWVDYKNFLLFNPQYKIKEVSVIERKLFKWSAELKGNKIALVEFNWDSEEQTFKVMIKEIMNKEEFEPELNKIKNSIELICSDNIKPIIYENC